MSHPQEQELPSIFSIIWSRRRIAFGVIGLSVAAGIAYTLFAPAIWEAKATIVFPVRTPSLLGASSFDQTSLAATLTGGPTPLKVFGGMLQSQHALEFVAKGSGLSKREVKDMRSIQDQAMESSLTVTARDKDPERAKKVVQLHLDALQQINKDLAKPLSADDADLLKSKVDEQRAKVAAAEQRLLRFQNSAVTAPSLSMGGGGKEGTILPASAKWAEALRQLELESKRVNSSIQEIESRSHAIAKNGGNLPAAIPPVQKWREKLTDMQYELQVQQLTLAPDAPEVVKLQKAIDVTRRQMRSEIDKYAAASSEGTVDKLPDLVTQKVVLDAQLEAVGKLAKLAPGEAIQLSRLTREVSTEGSILQQLQAQYELASIQADRDPNRWEVLDEPEVDEKPVNKSFSRNGILSLILGVTFGAFAALVWPKPKKKPAAEADEPMRRAA